MNLLGSEIVPASKKNAGSFSMSFGKMHLAVLNLYQTLRVLQMYVLKNCRAANASSF
jgi:hypothetical protein